MFKSSMKILIVLMLSASILLMAYNEFMRVQFVHQAKEVVNQQITCLAKNIFYEAAMEPYEGKLAVAQVTMNRTRNPQFPHTVCGVVYEKDQFSWVAEKHKGITDKYAWEECVMIAKRALTEHKLHDTIYKTKSMYYHNTSVNPPWKLKYVAKIGNHLFYTR